MIVNQFRSWARQAAPTLRADTASAVAQAYIDGDLDATQRTNAVAVLTALLEDPSPLVRRALADAFADARNAPHHIVLALADDQSEISSIVLARSPLLSDAELIDCAAGADAPAQSAIAGRPRLSSSVAAALAEIANPDALVALARNTTVGLPTFSIRRMLERHGSDGELREALLARPDLPSSIRIDLVAATARALAAFVAGRNWMSEERLARVTREAKDRAAIVIAESDPSRSGSLALVAHLREAGQLTVGFVLRAILCGKTELFRAALADLSGVPLSRVDGLVAQSGSTGFAALYRKAGLPAELMPAFKIALKTAREVDWSLTHGAALSRVVIERVLSACAAINNGELDKLMVLLRRFEIEAARDETREAPLRAESRAPLMLGSTRKPLLLADAVPASRAASEDRPTIPSHLRSRPAERREPLMLMSHVVAIEAQLRAA